jgi:hypothetical protein
MVNKEKTATARRKLSQGTLPMHSSSFIDNESQLPSSLQRRKGLAFMIWKTCSVEAGHRIGKRQHRIPARAESCPRKWDAKDQVDDVLNALLY